jgi:hypothetical protein
MGGGGGSTRRFDRKQLERLEQTARDAVRGSGKSVVRNVFISFPAEDLDKVNLLRGQKASEASSLEFSDRSVQQPYNSENAEYIRARIREKIRQASVTLVFLSDATPKSQWVEWEITESIRQGKGVVCVHAGEVPPTTLPRAVTEHKLPIVPWKHDQLMQAVERAAKDRNL